MNRPLQVVANVARQWWFAMATVVVVLTLGGVIAGSGSQLSSTVYFRVDPSSEDSSRVTQSTQTAVRLVSSPTVYESAAARSGTTAADLSQRATVAVVPSSELVSVSVRCGDADVCVRELTAIADATKEQLGRSAADQFATIGSSGVAALTSGRLPDADAERSRREAIGTSTADRQNGALAAGSDLTQVGVPTAPAREGLTPEVGGAVGAIVGLIAAALGALLLGARVGRVRRAHDWTVRRGTRQVYDVAELPALARRLALDRCSLVLVLTAGRRHPGSEDDVRSLAMSLKDELELEGLGVALVRLGHSASATLVDPEGSTIAPVRSPLGLAPRNEMLARCRAQVAVAYCDTRIPQLERAAGRVPAAIFLAEAEDTRFGTLSRTLDSLQPSPTYAVMA